MKLSRVSLLSSIVMLASFSGMAEAGSACTTSVANGSSVNGKSLWGEVPTQGGPSADTCDVDQFAWNNFLYLTADDSSGHPRFMSLAPWYDALPKLGKPVWTGKYAELKSTQMNKNMNHLQAGDSFHLLDVSGKTVTYDIRVNEDFVNYIVDNSMYSKPALNKAANAFNADQTKGGVWLPPTTAASKKSALEIKTAWRDYGSKPSDCPSTTMHCEKDSEGIWWGLIGMHLVQKTPNHGEMIWASFEHVANAPDCAVGGSNPIQQNPAGLSNGWNLFNYDIYTAAGGKDKTCAYPQSGVTDPLCLTNSNPAGDNETWVSVNICRTDQLPPATNCDSATSNLGITSCLNSSVQTTLNNKWANYQLIGAEWGSWGAAQGQITPLTGCFNIYDGTGSGVGSLGMSCTNPAPTAENTMNIAGTTNLANTTMETWMQKGISLTTGSGKSSETWTQQDCFSCHQPTTASYQGDMSHLFGRVQQKTADIQAGPIFDNDQAKQVCPTVCKSVDSQWNGQWTTTVPGVMSVCGCEVKK
ncbi:MAG: hypothetical protein GQ532_00170 [Methylomarinum sp.]|nr:hypothetical protein [Methylomarinum sp.]